MIRRYVAGRCTNWELDDTEEQLSDGSAIAIWDMLYLTYSDFPEQRFASSNNEHCDLRNLYMRSILFLESDLDYEWPEFPSSRQRCCWLRNLFSLRRVGREQTPDEDPQIAEWRKAGDVEVWPFLRRQDYRDALANPTRLTDRSKEDNSEQIADGNRPEAAQSPDKR